ncbi:DUF4172 domain-containing protein [Polycladidibacter stylochi]|uniref:DUF4172 domain-containing protein n=1 Tax=Polycladidibacter stylochi TaxID=1807766 RepID=UPI0009EAAC9E
MSWNWQQSDWPHFRWHKDAFEALEAKFLHQSGILLGTLKHLDQEQQQGLKIGVVALT